MVYEGEQGSPGKAGAALLPERWMKCASLLFGLQMLQIIRVVTHSKIQSV